MARFKYLGEPPRPGMVAKYGPCKMIRVRRKDGSVQELLPMPPATAFVIGEDIGHDITDERSIRHMRANSRFEEIVS